MADLQPVYFKSDRLLEPLIDTMKPKEDFE
jgi:hypothetical protein